MLSTEERVTHLLEDFVLQGVRITNDSSWDELGLDSLDKVELLMDIEDEFNIALDDDVMTLLDDVGELIELINRVTK